MQSRECGVEDSDEGDRHRVCRGCGGPSGSPLQRGDSRLSCSDIQSLGPSCVASKPSYLALPVIVCHGQGSPVNTAEVTVN